MRYKKSIEHHLQERSLICGFIHDYHSKRWTIEVMCNVLKVSRGSYSRWLKVPVGKLKRVYMELDEKIKKTYDSSHNYRVAPNILNRDFYREEPAQACVSDITYIPCLDGFLYLTVVLDLFDRKVIGWSMSDSLSASSTVIPAIRMANRNRPFIQGVIFHSDRGVQYASKQTVNVLESLKACQSMSRKGNCWDNAVAESFF